ncbi:MAG: hypothetical protein H6738_06945 [Alphaproteobacteria bacterium]|nr:hypothetical protein [Alphaproteobacteria bacterium]MCB9696499.1 hypothetical protein [Alphaproteobacteria bacterium]
MPGAEIALPGPRASSVTQDGQDDGFVVGSGWSAEATPQGDTRIVASVPHDRLHDVLVTLIGALAPPLGVLYRRKVDRRTPGPENGPPTDFVGLDLAPERVIAALEQARVLVASDARAELWFRGRMQEQVVLDGDGLLFCYPDDPMFRDALARAGVPAEDVPTMSERDYVKHWFRMDADAEEDALIDALRLTRVPSRRG